MGSEVFGKQMASRTRGNSLAWAMHDVWFAVAVSAAIEALLDMQGLGHVRSLQQAMARDAYGRLQALTSAFVM